MQSTERRSFLKWLTAAAAALVAFPARLAQAKKLAIGLDKLPELAKVGGSASKKILGHPVVFVRDTETSVRAFNPTCTHKKCMVDFKSEDMKFHCKCHKSAYDLDGKVLGGPAPAPLTRFRSKLSGDRVLIEVPDTPPPPEGGEPSEGEG